MPEGTQYERADYMSEVLSAAVGYASRGWHIFPVRGKTPLPGSNGFLDATDDPFVIKERWTEGDLGIGVATGAVSGIIVLDIDKGHGGIMSLNTMQADLGLLPDTLTSFTGGGGMHYFFQHPGFDVRNTTRFNGYDGIDIRGDGGYVVLPPSRHPSGNPYRWALTRDIAPAPAYLCQQSRRQFDAVADDDMFPSGTRNEALTRLAGAMRRYGAPADAVLDALLATNLTRCDPPLPEREIEQIARSSIRFRPSYSPGRGESRDSGSAGNSGGRANEDRLPQERPFFRTDEQVRLRRGTLRLGRRR